MIYWYAGLFAIGIFLSAFFSGSETGFYRVTRVRLVLDGKGGDRVAPWLLTLTNHPSLFVATTLIGNNIANYLVSLAIVLAVHDLPFSRNQLTELLAPVLVSPFVFVYGELMPKNLFYHAPNLLLRRSGPLFLLFAICLLPASGILWALGRLLETLVGETPLRVKMTLARRELQRVLSEGQDAGILNPAQRRLAQEMFASASQPVAGIATSLSRVPTTTLGTSTAEVLQLAGRARASIVIVVDPKTRMPHGYVRIVDLLLVGRPRINEPRPLLRLPRTESHIAALIRMQSEKEEVACIEDEKGAITGILLLDHLTGPLFRVA